jgi:hypothetical protein
MTTNGFAEVVTILEKVYRITLDKETRKVWWALLVPYDDRVVKANAMAYCRTNHYPPAPADLIGDAEEPAVVRQAIPGPEATQKRLEGLRQEAPAEVAARIRVMLASIGKEMPG